MLGGSVDGGSVNQDGDYKWRNSGERNGDFNGSEIYIKPIVRASHGVRCSIYNNEAK